MSADYQLLFRLINGLIVLALASTLIVLIALPHMTIKDIIVCILTFLPTGWGLLLVSIMFYSLCVLYSSTTIATPSHSFQFRKMAVV